jgi:hypothetical protein
MARLNHLTRCCAGAATLAAALLVIGCSSPEKAASSGDEPAMAMLNDQCPIMGKQVDEGSPSLSYGGHRIGFCCKGCVNRWEEMSAVDRDAFVASYTAQ